MGPKSWTTVKLVVGASASKEFSFEAKSRLWFVVPQTGATLPRIPLSSLEKRRVIGQGAFGEVCLSWWEGGHTDVAVKANGVSCANVAAIDNERRLLELLLQRPHRNILVVYGIVTDAPDGNVRLVMSYCPGGGLDGFLNAVRESDEV